MKTSFILAKPMQSIFVAKYQDRLSANSLIVVLGALLISIAAQISIPLFPIPLTLLDMAVLFCGMAFGARIGFCIVVLYLIMGLSGLPVFTDGMHGFKLLHMPVCGYLIGLLPAVVVSGFLIERGWGHNIITAGLAATIGMGILFACGLYGLHKHHPWLIAWEYGAQPFIGISILKIIVLAGIIPHIWKVAQK
jgi:biotin transport system substrate-specific component